MFVSSLTRTCCIGITVLVLFSSALPAQNLYFPPVTGSSWETTAPQSLNWCPGRIDSLYNMLETNNTKAFILLKDGKIVLEQYFNGHTASSNWYWASAGKSLTAFLVGLAQQDSLLNINESTSKYLGAGWTACDSASESLITIRNQLTMTSGLDDGVDDHYCTLDTCLVCLAPPGTRWAYHNGPYTLLDQVMEEAAGITMNQFVNQKLRNSTGITGLFIKNGYNNVFYSTARSMARFGLLMLGRGKWNGTPVMTDTTYFHDMTHPSQSINKSYGYLWWLNGQQSFMLPGFQLVIPGYMTPDAPADAYAAMGKNGQFVSIIPSQGMVWVRMGEEPGGAAVPYLLHNLIWEYINRLPCASSAVKDETEMQIRIYPNPASEILTLELPEGVFSGILSDFSGHQVHSYSDLTGHTSLNISGIPAGFYRLSLVHQADGRTVNKAVFISDN
jgi:CubicO group peptidase (beta-lactamase class C family)